MRRGRPILYVTGELVDAVNLKRLAQAAGGLPMPAEFSVKMPCFRGFVFMDDCVGRAS